MRNRREGGVDVRTIAVVSMKGGVGKTTLALSMAVSMARELPKNKKLLVVDSDPQGNASMTLLKGESPKDPTLSQVLLAEAEAREAIRPSRHPAIDLLPANLSLADCTLLLADQMGREQRLRAALRDVEKSYDVCIIDAPPTMSLLNVNVLNAALELVVPVDPGVYSAVGLGKLQETVDQVRRHLCHPELTIVALAIVRVQRHKAHADFERQLRELYGPLVLKSTVPDSVMVSVACSHHMTVGEYAPSSPAAVALERLVKELTHGQGTRRKVRSARPNNGKSSKRRAG
jgi:chromosome partitioning protein